MPLSALEAKTRKREIVYARQIVMFLAVGMGLGSLAEVGAQVGGKDHATVLHARKTINNLLDAGDKKTTVEVKDILAKLHE